MPLRPWRPPSTSRWSAFAVRRRSAQDCCGCGSGRCLALRHRARAASAADHRTRAKALAHGRSRCTTVSSSAKSRIRRCCSPKGRGEALPYTCRRFGDRLPGGSGKRDHRPCRTSRQPRPLGISAAWSSWSKRVEDDPQGVEAEVVLALIRHCRWTSDECRSALTRAGGCDHVRKVVIDQRGSIDTRRGC